MTIKEIKNLRSGDEVFWTDPDEGECSRYIIIRTITIEEGSDILSIYGQDGDYLQCFAHELS